MTENLLRQVVSELGIEVLTKNSSGWLVARCPFAPLGFHARNFDREPSFFVHVNNKGISGFNCFGGKERYLTWNGARTFEETTGTVQTILAPDGSWRQATIRYFGDQDTLDLKLSRNGKQKVIRTTAGHRWFLRPRVAGEKAREVTTSKLKKNDRLLVGLPYEGRGTQIDNLGFFHGVVFGDGTSRKDRPGNGALLLFGDKMLLRHLLESVGIASTVRYVREGKYGGVPEHLRFSGKFGHFKEFPNQECSERYMRGFLAGYLATDGHVTSSLVQLASSRKEDLEKVKVIANRLGIGTYGIGTALRKGYGKELSEVYTLNFVRGTMCGGLFKRPDQEAVFSNKGYDRVGWKVVSVTPSGEKEPVYCAEVPDYAAFVLEGYIATGNCYTCKQKGSVSSLVERLAHHSGEDYGNLALRARLNESKADFGQFGEMPEGDTPPMALEESLYAGVYPFAWEHPRAMEYLIGRGVSKESAIIMGLLFDPEKLRVLFPVRDYAGKLFGFSGRSVIDSGDRKMGKVNDYAGLKKVWQILGENLVRESDQRRKAEGKKPAPLLVVEGLFAFAHMVEIGAREWVNPVATLGSSLSEHQRDKLASLDRPTYFLYDDDLAGDVGLYGRQDEKTGEHLGEGALDMMRQHVPTYICDYPPRFGEGEGDPDKMTRNDLFWTLKQGSKLFTF